MAFELPIANGPSMAQPLAMLAAKNSEARSLAEARIPRILREQYRNASDESKDFGAGPMSPKTAIELLVSEPAAIVRAYGAVALAEVLVDVASAQQKIANGAFFIVEQGQRFGGTDADLAEGRRTVDQAWAESIATRDAALTELRAPIVSTIIARENAEQEFDDNRFARVLSQVRAAAALTGDALIDRIQSLTVDSQRKELRAALVTIADEVSASTDPTSQSVSAHLLLAADALTPIELVEARNLLAAIDAVEPHVDLYA